MGDLVVRLKQRLDGEDFYTEYAVLTYDGPCVVHLFDCFGYGDDLDYIQRKFADVVRTVTELQAI